MVNHVPCFAGEAGHKDPKISAQFFIFCALPVVVVVVVVVVVASLQLQLQLQLQLAGHMIVILIFS